MEIAARTGAWSGKALPYDAEVEFLGFNGTQLINTGITFDNVELATDVQAVVKTRMKYNAKPTKETQGGGITWVSGTNLVGRLGFGYRSGNMGIYQSAAAIFGIPYDNDIHTYEHIFGHGRSYAAYIDAVKIGSGTRTARTNTAHNVPFYIGAAVSGTTGTITPFDADYNIYNFYIENSLTGAKFDGIPVRVGNVGYLYECVSGRLFGNVGTGAFVVGPDKVSQLGWGGYKRKCVRRAYRRFSPRYTRFYPFTSRRWEVAA